MTIGLLNTMIQLGWIRLEEKTIQFDEAIRKNGRLRMPLGV